MDTPTEHPREMVLRQPLVGRVSLCIGVAFIGVAALLFAIFGIRDLRTIAQQNTERTQAAAVTTAETNCRAGVQQALDEARGLLDAEQGHGLAGVARNQDISAIADKVDDLAARVEKLAQLRGQSFVLCHADPNYIVPEDDQTP